MPGYMIFDTETSALMDFKRSADAPGQPRVAEFAAVLTDLQGHIELEFQRYVTPDGWTVDEGAYAINGLTDDFLREHGHPISETLDFYAQRIQAGYFPVAYGAQFDCKMMRAELRLAGRDDLFEITKNLCLMREARPFAKSLDRTIVKAGGSNKGWPKLSDLCAFLGVEQDAEHGAIHDARSLTRSFQKMLELGYKPEPSVHHAKNYEEIRSAQ